MPPLLLSFATLLASAVAQYETSSFRSTLIDENSPCYVVCAPRVVRPGQIYRVGVLVCLAEESIVRAVLHVDGRQVSADTQNASPYNLQTLTLKIPKSVSNGSYSLTVEGSHKKKNLWFKNETKLDFNPKFLSILIETSRPIYRSGQTVRFRIILLKMDLNPYDDGVDVFIIDSDGIIMRRWLSAFTNSGVVSLSFKLPRLLKEGTWKIRVKAFHQIEEQNIKVENYFSPLFEVLVELPPYISATEKFIEGKAYGLFTTEKLARGNMTLQLYTKRLNMSDPRKLVWENTVFVKSKIYKFLIPMEVVTEAEKSLSDVEITLEAAMTESLYATTSVGFCKSRIITSSVIVRFLSSMPAFFKPGMNFFTQVAINYQDYERIHPDILAKSKMTLQVSFNTGSGGGISYPDLVVDGDPTNSFINKIKSEENEISVDPQSLQSFTENGFLGFNFVTPKNAEIIHITALYKDEFGNEATGTLKCLKYNSPKNKYLAVWTTTQNAVSGEYAIFHVKSNFWMSRFHYLVISKNYIVNGGDILVNDLMATTTSFPVALSPEMAPGFKLIVFHITPNQEVLADSIFLPVYAFGRYETKLRINTGKDFKGNRVEIIVSADGGSFIGIHGTRSNVYRLQAGNEITESKVTDSLLSFEFFNRSLHQVFWQSRNGTMPHKTIYFPSMDYGSDMNSTFQTTGLVLFSHYEFKDNVLELCPGFGNRVPCADGGCFREDQRCDGKQDCSDSSDEINCQPKGGEDYDYRINRMSRYTFLYDAEYGDWGWREVKTNDHRGNEYLPVDAPFFNDEWYFTAFSMGPRTGFSIVKQSVVYSTKRPFTAVVSGPPQCHRGEQVGLRIILHNHDPIQALIFIQLLASPDYKFVHVEQGGLVSSYGARLSSGDHHLLVYIAPESQEQVDFPIAPTIEHGTITVRFVASSQAARSVLTHEIEVLPEGGMVSAHTAVILDLKNRAYVLNYLDIIVEESPIVPYAEWRRYVYGSPKSSVTVSGDIIGPIFPEKPLTKYGILGVFGKGTDARMFEFAMNIWTLHYLRLTSQLSIETLKEVLEECTALFAHIMKRFNPQGWFTNWDSSQPSVWLTGWVLRALKASIYSDWENILYVEQTIFEKCIRWLVKYQTRRGSFIETNSYVNPLDAKMKGQNETNIALTAHILITLCECLEVLEGESRSFAITAKRRAVLYLETALNEIDDPYQLAITSYALTLADSNERDLAFIKLQALISQTSEGLMYWSRTEIPGIPIKMENQRPFIQPRSFNEGDSEAVEGTAYALLVILAKDGATSMTDNIVQWLSSMRMSSSGLVSTVDTIVATQAITEYINQASLMDITKIDLNINVPSDQNEKHIFHIGNYSVSHEGYFDIPNVWGHVNVVAKGAGLALVQLDVSYGVEYDELKDAPSEDCFQLQITEYYSTVRNKSAITIQSCLRWVKESPKVSGAAILEIDIPSGYQLVENEAVEIAESGMHPTLRDAETMPGKTVWFFDHIPGEMTCFNHTVRRWYPVANMTLYRSALLYEASARERFVQTLFNSTPLYILNICEVCGSYQCPYCPYYNGAQLFQPSIVLLVFSFTYSMYSNCNIANKRN